MNMEIIYKLIDPRTDSPRYVGKTTKPLSDRLCGHIQTKTPKIKAWIDELSSVGCRPKIEPIETVRDLGHSEAKWINRFLSEGHDLLNTVSRDYSFWVPHPGSDWPMGDRAVRLRYRLIKMYPDAEIRFQTLRQVLHVVKTGWEKCQHDYQATPMRNYKCLKCKATKRLVNFFSEWSADHMDNICGFDGCKTCIATTKMFIGIAP
jgi:hypothetical protein